MKRPLIWKRIDPTDYMTPLWFEGRSRRSDEVLWRVRRMFEPLYSGAGRLVSIYELYPSEILESIGVFRTVRPFSKADGFFDFHTLSEAKRFAVDKTVSFWDHIEGALLLIGREPC